MNNTFDLLINPKKQIKKKYKENNTRRTTIKGNRVNIVCNNIEPLINNISELSNDELNLLLNTMIVSSNKIVKHKNSFRYPITQDTIYNLKSLIVHVKLSFNKKDTEKHNGLKVIKIKSKTRRK